MSPWRGMLIERYDDDGRFGRCIRHDANCPNCPADKPRRAELSALWFEQIMKGEAHGRPTDSESGLNRYVE